MTVYFVKSTALDLIKIGHTTNLESRLSAISKDVLEIVLLGYREGDRELEQSLHKKFAEFHESGGGFLGREWFKDNRKLRYYISRHCVKPLSDMQIWGEKPEPGIRMRFRKLFFDNRVKRRRSIGITEISRETGIHVTMLRKYGYELPMQRVESDHIEALCAYFACDIDDLIYIEKRHPNERT